TDAGADVDGVIRGMSPSINSVVHDALQFGTAVPASMKPMLQKMVDLGLLTDISGKKFSDLSGFKFDDAESPLQKGMKDLKDALDHLTETLQKLPGFAKTAADGIGTELGKIK